MNSNTNHDPLDREMPGEGHIAGMGRDVLAPGWARLYAIVRESGPDYQARARAALERWMATNESRQKNPQKDQEHAWSARAIADQMEAWYNANIRGKPPINRLPAVERLMPPKPRPCKFAVGAMVELTAPIHPPSPCRLEQIGAGTMGIVREIVARDVNPGAMVEFLAIKETHLVFFDRLKIYEGEA